MSYVFRADASQSIGSGHVMRCSAIAEELISRGEEVVFVGEYAEVPWLVDWINGLGFSQIFRSPISYISNPVTDVLILDSYRLPIEDEFIQNKKWKGVVSIVDELTPNYFANLVIHPGISVALKSHSGTKILTGPKYIPLRKSIKKSEINRIHNKSLTILIVGGGTDSFNFVDSMCSALQSINAQFKAYFFTNNAPEHNLDYRFTALKIGSELDEYANSADLVFTTASTTSLEFVAREVAIGIGCAIDNQEECYQALSSANIAMPIGRFILGNWNFDDSRIKALVISSDIRDSLRNEASGFIDLGGAKRVVDEILKL